MKNHLLLTLICFVVACVPETPAVQSNEPVPPKTATPQPERAEQTTDNELEATKKRYSELQGAFTKVQGTLHETAVTNAELQKQVDASAQLIETMKQQLTTATGERDQLEQQAAEMKSKLAEMKAKLEELTQKKESAEQKEAVIRDLFTKLRSVNGVDIATRDGRMILAMSTDVLFDSGQIKIKEKGRAALTTIAQTLKSVSERKFLMAGHTDDVPIRTREFSSNWELSTRRAVEVVRYLIQQKMEPKSLVAAGYGEFAPIATNDTNEHRAQNRRIEIVLLPEITPLPPP